MSGDARDLERAREPDAAAKDLVVRSHWNMDDRVVLAIGGKERVYIAADLIHAIERCSR